MSIIARHSALLSGDFVLAVFVRISCIKNDSLTNPIQQLVMCCTLVKRNNVKMRVINTNFQFGNFI